MSFPETVLLVDDEPGLRKPLRDIVRSLGAQRILEAANGAQALEFYQAERPGLVLLDLTMPVMDGLETLSRLRALDPRSLVVIYSSHSTEVYLEEVLAAGAANYICKLSSRAEICSMLRHTTDLCYGPSDPARNFHRFRDGTSAPFSAGAPN